MLTPAKKRKFIACLKDYQKTYLRKKFADLDESGTRLMINSFLSDVLGYTTIEEIRTEYMIRGSYADYMIQINGKRYFLVEVKAMSIDLAEKHLRQAVNYGANEGLDYALLTNGRCFELYKILFNKPIESRLIFSIDLTAVKKVDEVANDLICLHKEAVLKGGLDLLWSKCQALDEHNIAGLLYSPSVVNFIKRELKAKYKHKFEEEEVIEAIKNLLTNKLNLEKVKPVKKQRVRKAKIKSKDDTAVKTLTNGEVS